MQYLFILIAFFLTPTPFIADSFEASTMRKSVACDFFVYENAQKILGKKVRAEDGEMSDESEGRFWRCTFTGPTEADRAPKLHFVLIRSVSDDAAKQAFEVIRDSNKNKAGFEEWPGVADEAIVHSDGKNFQFVMVRKAAKTIRMKVNPANGVSLDEVKNVAASLALKL